MLNEVFLNLSFRSSLCQRACFNPDIWRGNCITTCSCGLLYSLVAHIYTGCADRAAWRFFFFFCSEVDRLFPCSLLCMRVCWASLCAVNKICFCPQTMADRVLLCVWQLHRIFFPWVIGYVGLSWQLVRCCSLWFFSSFFSIKKEEAGWKLTPPYQPN